MEAFLRDIAERSTADIHVDEKTRAAASRDTSLFSVMPKAVVAPKTAADVGVLVRAAAAHPGVTLTARSAGTGMDGGALSESVIVDFTAHLNRLKGFSGTQAVVEPGLYYRDFEKETLKRNLLMPSYPASRELCAMGGIVANNSGGELTLAYGKTARYVRALKMVLADGNEYTFTKLNREALDAKVLQRDFEGELYRKIYSLIRDNLAAIEAARPHVSKNSAGYALWDVYNKDKDTFDLTKLFVGAQGTLGLMTEATFDLVTPDPHSQMMVVFLDNFDRLGDIVKAVLVHTPTTFESYDDKTLSLAIRFFGAFVKKLGFRNMLSIARHSIPEALSILRHGLPKLVLQITFDGKDPAVLKRKADGLAKALREFRPRYVEIVSTNIEMKEYWLIRRESFNLLRHKVQGMKTAPFIDDIVVPPQVLPEFLPRLYAILNEYNKLMVHNIAGHIGNGNFHIIPLMDLSKKEVREAIPVIAKRVYALVLEYKGSITGEHNDGIIRTPFLKDQFGEHMTALFAETKKIFDPQHIFNPGKKVPSTHPEQAGTLDYAIAHIAG